MDLKIPPKYVFEYIWEFNDNDSMLPFSSYEKMEKARKMQEVEDAEYDRICAELGMDG